MKKNNTLIKEYKQVSFKIFVKEINNNNKGITQNNNKLIAIEKQLQLRGIYIN